MSLDVGYSFKRGTKWSSLSYLDANIFAVNKIMLFSNIPYSKTKFRWPDPPPPQNNKAELRVKLARKVEIIVETVANPTDWYGGVDRHQSP